MNRTHSSIILGLVLLSMLLLFFVSFGGLLLSAQGEESMFDSDTGDSAALAPATGAPAAELPAVVEPGMPSSSPVFRGRAAPGRQAQPAIGLSPNPPAANAAIAPATGPAAPNSAAPANAGQGVAAAQPAAPVATAAGASLTGVASQGTFGGMVPLVTPVPAGGGGGVPVSRG